MPTMDIIYYEYSLHVEPLYRKTASNMDRVASIKTVWMVDSPRDKTFVIQEKCRYTDSNARAGVSMQP